jgi:hypothetical protein
MIKEDITKKIINDYSEESQNWKFANDVLYDLCKGHIRHDDKQIIVAKLFLIGRSYAAAIERRKTDDKMSTEEFYYEQVAPKMMEIGSELDERIEQINKMGDDLSEENIKYILNTHGFLTREIRKITGMDKRSLVSKYLHFHCRKSFFIFDSITSGNIGICVNKDKGLYDRIYQDDYDEIYCDFYLKAYQISHYAKEKLHRDLSPRDIDYILLSLKR